MCYVRVPVARDLYLKKPFPLFDRIVTVTFKHVITASSQLVVRKVSDGYGGMTIIADSSVERRRRDQIFYA